MPEYLSVLHVYHSADDDVRAIAEADDIKLKVEYLLDPDLGEACDVVQTIPSTENPVPSANIIQLRRARNILIRTGTKENYDLARSLDQSIHVLHQRIDSEYKLVSYDWSRFMDVLKEIVDGGNPLDY